MIAKKRAWQAEFNVFLALVILIVVFELIGRIFLATASCSTPAAMSQDLQRSAPADHHPASVDRPASLPSA